MSRMAATLTVLLFVLCPASVFPPVAAQEPTPEELAWIRDNSIPIKTAEPGSGLDDLQPLKDIIGDAHIVALGEGTHGTREFFQMKHRLVEFLVTEMGFSIFSIEANMPEAYKLNDYVLKGEGDPKELIGGMYFWTWNTEEVLALVEWMREFNASGKGRIEFTGFDMQTPHIAAENVCQFLERVDPEYAAKVRDTYKWVNPAHKRHTFATYTHRIPYEPLTGKRICYSGYIKVEGVEKGFAGMWWRVDGPEKQTLAFDNMLARQIRGTQPWKRFEIELPVAEETVNINFGALLSGSGTAWFDDLTLEVDGQPYEGELPFDSTFEDEELRELEIEQFPYEITIDDRESHSGSCSLRIAYKPDHQAQSAPAPKTRAWHCTTILETLKAKQAEYEKATSPEETAWALQNAQVVLQSALAEANILLRDQSMADNVRWIADHNPDAKIVLWAHNAHVQRSVNPSTLWGTPMGVYLGEAYGDKFLVVGFACNSGSYTATSQSKGLNVHELIPAQPGCAEYYLHKAELPRFILNLRRANQADAASAWLTQPRMFRGIGAWAMPIQFQPVVLRDAFDLLVYLDETTYTIPLDQKPWPPEEDDE